MERLKKPIQSVWTPIKNRLRQELVQRGHCSHCKKNLSSAERTPHPNKESIQIVTCQCNAQYLYDTRVNSYSIPPSEK